MTLQEIQELTIEDCVEVLRERLGLAEDESASVEQLESELELYKAELIEVEEARLAEVARVQDLKDRYAALSDKGLLQGAAQISNPDAYFRDSVLKESPEQAEVNLLQLESVYELALSELQSNAWLENRKREYAKLDSMLMEALAEKEAGRPEKMQEYLSLRESIKNQYPKE